MTVKNTGTAAVTLASVALAGTNATEFAMTNTCSTTVALAAGATCTVSLTFDPMTSGDKTATVNVTDSKANVLSATVTATATGTSTTAAPVTSDTTSNKGGGGAIGAGGAIEWLYGLLLAMATVALTRNRVASKGAR
jgi:hypothetical protein